MPLHAPLSSGVLPKVGLLRSVDVDQMFYIDKMLGCSKKRYVPYFLKQILQLCQLLKDYYYYYLLLHKHILQLCIWLHKQFIYY